MPWGSSGTVMQLARARGTPCPVAPDVDGMTACALGDAPATPTRFLVDPDGGIAVRRAGAGAPDFPAIAGRPRSMP